MTEQSKLQNEIYSLSRNLYETSELIKNLDKQLIEKEIDYYISDQIKPRQIILKIVEFLQRMKIEIPSYWSIANLIAESFNCYEKKLLSGIKELIDDRQISLLDDLIKISKSDGTHQETQLLY